MIMNAGGPSVHFNVRSISNKVRLFKVRPNLGPLKFFPEVFHYEFIVQDIATF